MRDWWWRARQREDDLDEEIAHDLRVEADERIHAGARRADAEHASRQDFGDIARIKAATRVVWVPAERTMQMSRMGEDLRRMIRLVRSHTGYVSLASGVLALAIGLNVLVFSIVNALWLRPLPIADPAQVVTIIQTLSTTSSLDAPYLKVFNGPIAGQIATTGFFEAFKPQIAIPQAAGPIETLGVTPAYFAVLGVPVRGRAFTDADDRAGAEPVGIISDRLWTNAFARNPATIGLVVAATPRPLRIIGIAPPHFEGARRGERADLWVPTQVVRDQAPDDRQVSTPTMMVFARLGPGQTIGAIEQRYRDLRRLPDGQPVSSPTAPTVVPVTEVFGTSDSPTILIRENGTLGVVFGLSLLVLLGGCLTIAALVLTHYERRRPELALRASLGASRGRLARELTAELLVVGLAGSAGAIVCEWIGARVLPALSLPGGVNIGRLDLSADWRLCAVALAAAVVTLALAGAVPMWHVTHARLAGEVSTAPVTATRTSLRTRRRLLTLQVCATTIVLIASGLFVRTVLYSFRTGAGFDLDRTVFVTAQEKSLYDAVGLDRNAGYELGRERRAQMSALLAQLPSVRAVSGGAAPLGDRMSTVPRTIATDGREQKVRIGVLNGTPNLLSVLGVPLLAGRALEAADTAGTSPLAVVVTRSLAERLWPAGNAVGRIFSLTEIRLPSCEVVGVADNFAFGTLSRPIDGVIVTAKGDSDFTVSNFVVNADDPAAVLSTLPAQLRGRVVQAATGREVVARDIAQQRLGAWAFSGFGLVALLLGVGGVFGLVAYLAQSRRREFGVRMALGATLPNLVRSAVTMALGPVVVGVTAGLLLGAIASRVFSALLVGIGRLDPATYAGVGLVVLIPAALSAWAAGWRLRHLTPSDALRRA